MKNLYILITILFLYSGLKAQCPNGNAEQNSFTNWSTLMSSTDNPQSINLFSSGFSTTEFGIENSTSTVSDVSTYISNGVDLYGGFQLPSQGTYCFRLGSNRKNGVANMMKYTFTVTNANKYLKVRYALVF